MKVHSSDLNAVPFVMERFVERCVRGRAVGVLLRMTMKGRESVVKGFMEGRVRGNFRCGLQITTEVRANMCVCGGGGSNESKEQRHSC
jgi:hypothetical protein